MKVYIAGPMTKGNQYSNVYNATQVWKQLFTLGFVPFLPHLTAYLELSGITDVTYEQWLDYDFHWIESCDAVYRMPGDSPGADAEVAFARRCGIPVFTSIEDMVCDRDDGWLEERQQ